jgi:hypothetical protein
MRSRAGLRLPARPTKPCRLFTGAGEPHAAHRLLQSDRPASTPYEPSKPGGSCLRSDAHPATRPLAGRSQPSGLESGVARRLLAVSTPAQRPLAARIYPDSKSTRTPTCREADTAMDRNQSRTAIRGSDPSREGGSARLGTPGRGLATTLGRGLPLGPPSTAVREHCDGRLHPGCLPPSHPHVVCAGAPPFREGRRPSRRVSPDRLSLARATPLLPKRPES